MGQKKLLRFAQIKTFANVLEYPKDVAGTWNKIFNNNHPIVLELACGRGEYAVGLGEMFPEKNFIGIDIKGNNCRDRMDQFWRILIIWMKHDNDIRIEFKRLSIT